MAKVSIGFGRETLALELEERQAVSARRAASAPAIADVAAAVWQALEAPREFPPLRRALTPDDHLAIVVREELNRLPDVLAPILEHILAAGVSLANITVVCPPRLEEPENSDWRDRLPAELRPVAVEVHDPANRTHLAYLASTKAGRRVYLNRTVVDADQVVVLSRIAFDPVLGYAGGLGDLFPALSDEATRSEFALRVTASAPGARNWNTLQEAHEVGWLFGMPFVLEVMEGAGDEISYVIGGAAKATAEEGERLLNRHWRVHVDRTAQVVVAGIGGDPRRQTFADVSRALACAARVVRVDGVIVVLSRAQAPAGRGGALLRDAESPVRALLLARQQKTPDVVSIWQLATAAQHARLYLFSDIPQATAEELFVTPLEAPAQVERLLEGAESVLVLPDAHRTLAVLD
jgi:nickel-dependent lactate racemase